MRDSKGESKQGQAGRNVRCWQGKLHGRGDLVRLSHATAMDKLSSTRKDTGSPRTSNQWHNSQEPESHCVFEQSHRLHEGGETAKTLLLRRLRSSGTTVRTRSCMVI